MVQFPDGLLRAVGDGTILQVRVTPKSSANRIGGIFRASDGTVSLQVRVTAQPEKGKANKAVTKTLAKALRLPKSSLSIASGETSRYKAVLVDASKEDLQKVLGAFELDI